MELSVVSSWSKLYYRNKISGFSFRYCNTSRKFHFDNFKEKIKSVVTVKHKFQNQGESIII